MCTWARLVAIDDGSPVYVFNVHLDHRGVAARRASTLLVRERMRAITSREGQQGEAVLLGDFNSAEDDEAITALTSPRADDEFPLTDVWRSTHPDEAAGTFTAFDPMNDGGTRRIDYLFVTRGWRVRGAGIDRSRRDGRWPSDHFPVWVELERG
ncbi:MAG: endonuclease/exonuclease/phosphatase family protein [Planctomycetes bacterium]|nr:endonuclease/exonuclease/phosphatase family protein [Planctomycetota bacterium]